MENDNILMQWAKMPLSEEELKLIPESHQIRPYLLFLDMGDFYYAFPATSKFYYRKSRYENEELLVRRVFENNSLVSLSKVYKLPKENLLSYPREISSEEVNQLYKKLNANRRFHEYPSEVLDKIDRVETKICWGDLIRHNGELYVVVGKVEDRESLYVLKVYNFEIDGTILKIVDGNKYYVDINSMHCINVEENTEYISVMYGFSFGRYEKSKDELKDYMLALQDIKRVQNGFSFEDYKYFDRLPVGTVIVFKDGDVFKKMIVVRKESGKVIVLEGLDKQLYRDFEVAVYPNDFDFSFKVEGMLTDERVFQLVDKKLKDADLVNKI